MKAEKNLCILISSSTNIDRIVSAFRACLQSNRIFVIDIYTAWILRLLSSSLKSGNTPDLSWDQIRVLAKGGTAGRHYEIIKNNKAIFSGFSQEIYQSKTLITEDEIKADPGRYLVKTNMFTALLQKVEPVSATILYSMWEGYITKQHNPKGYKQYDTIQADPKITFSRIHTSGHAYIKTLQEFADALKPKTLVPVHTESKGDYSKYFDNVKILDDGEVFLP